MKAITYRQVPPTGPDDSFEFEMGSIADLVRSIPYLLVFDLIPPMSVMNEVLGSGGYDAGMSGGCVWKSFAITEVEYEELVRELKGCGFRSVSCPEWVRNRSDWHIWTCEYEIGIPSEEHHRLWREEETWTGLKKQAEMEGDQEKAMEFHLKAIQAGRRLARFIGPFIRKYQKVKDRQQPTNRWT